MTCRPHVDGTAIDPATIRLAAAAEEVEQAAWRDFFAAAPADLVRERGIRVIDLPDGLALIAPGVRMSLCNRVLGPGTTQPVEEGTVAQIRDLYPAGGARYAIHPVPLATPVRDLQWWRRIGYEPGFEVAKQVRDTSPAQPVTTDLRIRRAGPDQAGTVADVLGTVWTDPPLPRAWLAATVGRTGWWHYMALDGDRPVAAAAMFTSTAGAWLGWAVTLPGDRRRGAQSALVARRIADARDAGCPIVTVDTGVDSPTEPRPSHRTMIRAGFTQLYIRPALFPHSPRADER